MSLLDTNFTQLANAINAIGIVGGTGTVTIGPPASGIGLVVSSSVSASSVSLTNCPGDFIGSANSYVQVDVHNSSNGGSSSSDFIATADTGSDTTLFVDVGINSSGFSDATWTISGALDSYLYASDGALTVGTKAAKSISFHTGGTLAANIRGTISSSGNWTINTPTSGTALTVGGAVVCTASANVNNVIYTSTNTGASSSSLFTDSSTSGLSLTVYNSAYAAGSTFSVGANGVSINNNGGGPLSIGTSVGAAFSIFTNNVSRISVASGGAVSISGQLGINGASGTSGLTGWGTPSGGVVVANYPGATATLVQTSNALAQVISQLIAFGIFKV